MSVTIIPSDPKAPQLLRTSKPKPSKWFLVRRIDGGSTPGPNVQDAQLDWLEDGFCCGGRVEIVPTRHHVVHLCEITLAQYDQDLVYHDGYAHTVCGAHVPIGEGRVIWRDKGVHDRKVTCLSCLRTKNVPSKLR